MVVGFPDGEPVTEPVARDLDCVNEVVPVCVKGNVGPDCVGVREPDLVAVGQADTEPTLTVQAAEGVATLPEPVGEMVGFTEPVPNVPVTRGVVDGVNPAEPVTVVLRLA